MKLPVKQKTINRMNKFVKWGIVAAIAIGAIIMGINTFTPKVNEELEKTPVQTKGKQSKDLNVRAVIIKESSISD